MAAQKGMSKIADAVKGILGDDVKKKKLKKAKAIKDFIGKMEAKRKEVSKELDKGGLKKNKEKTLKRHLDILDKEIKKAREILKEAEK